MQIQLKKEWLIPSGVGVLSFGLGVGAGYFLCHRKLAKIEEEYEEEIEELESNLMELDFDTPGYQEPETDEVEEPVVLTSEELDQQVEELIASVANEPVEVSVFASQDDEWDYDVETAKRESLDPKAPYIVHLDEFVSGESGYRQTTLTYYAGDGILVDEQEKPIYNHSKVVGELEFGHGSRDQNVVYVRNPEYEAEYEILRDSGMYQVEVLGQEIEDDLNSGDLKHSLHKFRSSD